jgi:hypothetical protein
MPSVKKYQSEAGYYIRSNIDGRFVTLQLSPEADGLLSELGFQGGENISWQFLQPLCEAGHAYTNNSGTEVTTDTIDTESAVSAGQLGPEDQERLEEFIAEHTPESPEDGHSEPPDEGGQGETEVTDIDEQKRSFIQRWSPSDDEYEATLNRIARADDTEGILKSVAHHGTEHPMSPERFRVSSRGIPTYSFATGSVAWTVHDYRTVRTIGTDAELFFEIQPGTAKAQSVTIEPDAAEWHTKDDQFTAEQMTDFVVVAPEILYYTWHLVSSPEVAPEDILDGATATVPSDDRDRVETLTTIQPVDPDEYARSIGTVLTLGESGYGRIRAYTGHTFKFHRDDIEGEPVNPGDVVTFDVKHNRRSVWADQIRDAEIGVSGSAIINRWPEYHDRSLAWVREHWTEYEGETEARSDTIVLPSGDENHQYETVSVTTDLLAFYLASNEDGTAATVDEAVRTLLKASIDGSVPAPEPPEATTEIEITLPENLVLMIESVIETAPAYQSQDQFFTAALQQQIADEQETELTVRVPSGYHDAAAQLAEDRDMSTAEFVRNALENRIATELKREE